MILFILENGIISLSCDILLEYLCLFHTLVRHLSALANDFVLWDYSYDILVIFSDIIVKIKNLKAQRMAKFFQIFALLSDFD